MSSGLAINTATSEIFMKKNPELWFEPRAAGSGSKYANRWAMPPPPKLFKSYQEFQVKESFEERKTTTMSQKWPRSKLKSSEKNFLSVRIRGTNPAKKCHLANGITVNGGVPVGGALGSMVGVPRVSLRSRLCPIFHAFLAHNKDLFFNFFWSVQLFYFAAWIFMHALDIIF